MAGINPDTKYTWFSNPASQLFEPTLKYWFSLMWQNWYIQTFVLAIAFFIGMATQLQETELWALLIPAAIIVAVVWGGFIKYYNDLKSGK